MSKIEIKTNNKNAYGKKRQFPIDGEVTIGEDGVAEVSEECAKLLVEGGAYFYADEEDDTGDLNDDGGDNDEDEDGDEDGDEDEDSGDEGENDEDGDEDGDEDNEFISDEEIMKYLDETLSYTALKKLVVKNKLDKVDKEAFKKADSKVKMLAYIKEVLTDDIRGAVTDLVTE
jgi:hypothetical protein